MTITEEEIVPLSFWGLRPSDVVNFSLSETQQRYLLTICEHSIEWEQVAMVRGLVPDVVDTLVEVGKEIHHEDVHTRLAVNPSLTLEQRSRLLDHGYKEAVAALMLSPTSEEELHHRILDETDSVEFKTVRELSSLASNKNISPSVQRRIALLRGGEVEHINGDTEDGSRFVRMDLARNPGLHPEAAALLSLEEGDVRATLRNAVEENMELTTPQMAVPFLQGRTRNDMSPHRWVLGYSYLRGVRSTLDREAQEAWDGLVTTWNNTVQDLVDAISLTRR